MGRKVGCHPCHWSEALGKVSQGTEVHVNNMKLLLPIPRAPSLALPIELSNGPNRSKTTPSEGFKLQSWCCCIESLNEINSPMAVVAGSRHSGSGQQSGKQRNRIGILIVVHTLARVDSGKRVRCDVSPVRCGPGEILLPYSE